MLALRAVIAGLKNSQPHGAADANDAILRSITPHIFILEFEQGLPSYRLAGGAIQAALGFDPQGKSFYVNWNSSGHGQLDLFFRAAIKTCRPFCIYSTGERSEADSMRFESVLIPMRLPGMSKDCFVGISIPLDGDTDVAAPIIQQHLQHITFLHDDLSAASSPFPRLVYAAPQ